MGTNSLNLGAISIDNNRTTALNSGNSSGTACILRLYDATVNSVANVTDNGRGLSDFGVTNIAMNGGNSTSKFGGGTKQPP